MSEFSQSAAIREAFGKVGMDAPSKDVCDWVKKHHGQEVDERLVNNVRFHQRKKQENGTVAVAAPAKRGRKPGTVVASTNGNGKHPVESTKTEDVLASEHERMNAVAKVMRQVGGLKNLKDIVSKLEETLIAAGVSV